MALAGCIPIPGRDGTTHHLVIGFGVVSVNEAPDQAVVATDVDALGLTISDRPGMKLGVGWTSSLVVTVADGAEDVRVEAARTPGGALTIDCPAAKLRPELTSSEPTSEGGPTDDSTTTTEADGDAVREDHE